MHSSDTFEGYVECACRWGAAPVLHTAVRASAVGPVRTFSWICLISTAVRVSPSLIPLLLYACTTVSDPLQYSCRTVTSASPVPVWWTQASKAHEGELPESPNAS